MHNRRLVMPWAQPSDLYSAPASLILKVALGEAPDAIPAGLDVRAGAGRATDHVGLIAVDRVLAHFSDRVRVTRVHAAAAHIGSPGRRHQGFDDLEHVFGLSHTLRIDSAQPCCVFDLVDALRQLSVVAQASPLYLCTLPFAVPQPPPGVGQGAAVSVDEAAWAPRAMIHTAEAMAYEPGDAAIIAGVLDTGVRSDGAELSGRVRAGLETVQLSASTLAAGIQLVDEDAGIGTDTLDRVGHGTACAAIIGGSGAQIPPGLAGDTGLLPMRVLGAARFPGRSYPVGIGAISDIDCGLALAVNLGAKVLNLSFGTPKNALAPGDPLPHEDAIRYALARDCILVAASGNSSIQEEFLPAAYPGVIAVGSVAADGRPSAFSTSGPHVALCAPGERVLSAGLSGYQWVTGTSFAAPFVTAAAALLVSRAARRSFPIDGPAVRRMLVESARPWLPGQGQGHGAGILDAHAALRRLDQEIDRSGYADLSRQTLSAESA